MNTGRKRTHSSDPEDDFSEDGTSGSEFSPGDLSSGDDALSPTMRVPKRQHRNARKKQAKVECQYNENCYRKNPDHFREYKHSHLEKILVNYNGSGPFDIPSNLQFQRGIIEQQLNILRNHAICRINVIDKKKDSTGANSSKDNPHSAQSISSTQSTNMNIDVNDSQNSQSTSKIKNSDSQNSQGSSTIKPSRRDVETSKTQIGINQTEILKCTKTDNPSTSSSSDAQTKPNLKRKIEDFFNVVAPKGRMKEKHERAAPYYMFFTTIASAPETHTHPLSITFQELLDPSLGKLKSSLQINFMVDVGWLLAQYYFADYSDKPLTILYGDDSEDLKAVNQKKRNIEALLVPMKNAFGKHHTKMGLYHYEDGSVRIVVSTANLYIDDWENRTQGLWLSPRCPRLADPYDVINGESPTGFKRSLINYLNSYSMPCLSSYLQIVKNIDFSDINVFFVASIPGGHFDTQWGLSRIGNLLSQHCVIPPDEADQWTFIAQASSIGSFGNDPKLWLCGDFQQNFCRSFKSSPMVTRPPQLKFIYPSLTNVKNSHDNLLGGGCLPYSNSIHIKQPWLNNYLHEWSAVHSGRNRAMPHIKSYLRMSPDLKRAPFFLLTSGNISKSAWGTFNKGNRALRINSYEVGVLFIPKFVVNKDYFSLELSDLDRLPVPYDLPPIPYESGEVPWVMDYLS